MTTIDPTTVILSIKKEKLQQSKMVIRKSVPVKTRIEIIRLDREVKMGNMNSGNPKLDRTFGLYQMLYRIKTLALVTAQCASSQTIQWERTHQGWRCKGICRKLDDDNTKRKMASKTNVKKVNLRCLFLGALPNYEPSDMFKDNLRRSDQNHINV